jgi:hypothetical protein
MDPYLEGSLWTTVHAAPGTEIAHQLVPKLRPRYVALPVERFVLDVPEDVAVATRERAAQKLLCPPRPNRGRKSVSVQPVSEHDGLPAEAQSWTDRRRRAARKQAFIAPPARPCRT